MKYKHLNHMPTAVEDWLEEQLEAHGIDAIVYTRYILSLLQQETLDDPHELLAFFSPNKKENRRGRKRWRREHVGRHSLDRETLKRLSVIHCLMSATDETCGIEKLVDELCVKLQEIQSQSTPNLPFSPSQQKQLSLLDPTATYNAAFPPLGKETNIDCTYDYSPSNVWTQHVLNHKSGQMTFKENYSPLILKDSANEFSFEFRRDMERYGERQDGTQDDFERVLYYNQQNMSHDRETKRLYERNTSDEENSDYDCQAQEQHLKELMSKFDHKIESLWSNDEKVDEQNDTEVHNAGPRMLLNFDCNIIQYGSNMASSIWSDGSGLDQVYEDGKFSSAFQGLSWGVDNVLGALNQSKKWSDSNQVVNTKISSLNHTEESCFTHVLPKYQPVTYKTENYVVEQSNKVSEEEDLLTSAKTHFRPIRVEEGKHSKAPVYADGTTFIIPNDWEKVPFKRSESGTLYLESDAELDAPKIYKEFKDMKAESHNNSECTSLNEEFVPKFHVRQSNEKCVQTEDFDDEQIVPTVERNEAEEYVANFNRKLYSDPDDFFFPGDDELADEIVHSDDDDSLMANNNNNMGLVHKVVSDVNYNEIRKEECDVMRTPNDVEICFCSNSWRQNWAKAWENKEEQKKTEWQQIWNTSPPIDVCKNCITSANNLLSATQKEKQFCQLREELCEDGEQLLSDLSCLQQKYLSCSLFDEDSEATEASDIVDDAPDLNFLNLNEEELDSKSLDLNNRNVESFTKVFEACKAKGIFWNQSHEVAAAWIEEQDTLWRPKNKIWKYDFGNDVDDWPANFKINRSESNQVMTEISIIAEDEYKNERPFIATAVAALTVTSQKDRKRRHSSSHRVCKRYMEDQCRLPHCRLIHSDSAVPRPFCADSTCLKEEDCRMTHGAANSYLLRPLTL